jgi:hypothetical protein
VRAIDLLGEEAKVPSLESEATHEENMHGRSGLAGRTVVVGFSELAFRVGQVQR